MKLHIKCPYCHCRTDNLERCEYCGKPISYNAKKKAALKADNFNTSADDHQHIKNDPRSQMPVFDHIPEENDYKQLSNLSKKKWFAFLFFIIWLLFIVFLIVFPILMKNG